MNIYGKTWVKSWDFPNFKGGAGLRHDFTSLCRTAATPLTRSCSSNCMTSVPRPSRPGMRHSKEATTTWRYWSDGYAKGLKKQLIFRVSEKSRQNQEGKTHTHKYILGVCFVQNQDTKHKLGRPHDFHSPHPEWHPPHNSFPWSESPSWRLRPEQPVHHFKWTAEGSNSTDIFRGC